MSCITHILLAEDDASIAEVTTIILVEEGYTVSHAPTISKLKSFLQKKNVHVILLDLWLGGENGEKICRELKSDEATKHIPVILCSASVAVDSVAETVGADDVLHKPFDIETLLEKVKKYTR